MKSYWIKMYAYHWKVWALDAFNLQNESEEFALIVLKEYKENFKLSSGGSHELYFVDNKEITLSDKEVINLKL